MAIRLGLVGLGQIARNRHVPSIAASPDFVLAAIADPRGGDPVEGVATRSTCSNTSRLPAARAARARRAWA